MSEITQKLIWGDTTEKDWDTPSLALVAYRGGRGVVLWYGGGPSLAFQIEEAGVVDFDLLGLDDCPEGISVWVGHVVVEGGPAVAGICDDSFEPVAKGTFRQPTADEWRDIQLGRNPWPKQRCSECGSEAWQPDAEVGIGGAILCDCCSETH